MKPRPSDIHEWWGVAEIVEIFEDAVGTDISDEEVPEDGGQSEWSSADCQELLGEEISEKIRINESVEEPDKPMEEIFDKLCPGKL